MVIDVSILISTKNYDDIEKQYDNFKDSKLKFEIIVVGPKKINSQLANFHSILSYCKPVQCLEIALNYSRGKWIIFWADDMFFLDKNNDNLTSIIELAKTKNKTLISTRLENDLNKDINSYRYDTTNFDTPLIPLSPPISREMLKKVGTLDKNFIATFSDIDLYMRLFSIGYDVFFTDIKIIEKYKTSYSLNFDYNTLDRRTIDNLWTDKKLYKKSERSKKYKILKTRSMPLDKFETDKLDEPQGPRGRWKFNNIIYHNFFMKIYFKIFKDLLKTHKLINLLYNIKRKLINTKFF